MDEWDEIEIAKALYFYAINERQLQTELKQTCERQQYQTIWIENVKQCGADRDKDRKGGGEIKNEKDWIQIVVKKHEERMTNEM